MGRNKEKDSDLRNTIRAVSSRTVDAPLNFLGSQLDVLSDEGSTSSPMLGATCPVPQDKLFGGSKPEKERAGKKGGETKWLSRSV